VTSPASTPLKPTSRRRKRSYLIDPRFQLKYTGLLVGVVIAVMAALGVVIWTTAEVASVNAKNATTQAERALKESSTSAHILKMSAAAYATDSPELGRTLDEELAEIDREYERSLAEVGQRRAEVEQQRQRLLYTLLGGGGTLVILLSVLGIFITHRIVGPVVRLKRLCRQVGTSRLNVKVESRKGDELTDLFNTFGQMTYSLKVLQAGRLATLDATIERAGAEGASPELLEGLRALRAQLCLGLGAEHAQSPGKADGAKGGQ
jgi:HAMP domain-containing protein